MAEQAQVQVDTGVDNTGLRKGLSETEQLIKKSVKNIEKNAKDAEKAVKGEADKATEAIKDSNKESLNSIQQFANDTNRTLESIDFTKLLGPAAGAAVVAGIKKIVSALNEMGDAWRKQEQIEMVLQNTVKNNPLLSDKAANQLKEYANEMQKISGIEKNLTMQSQTYLASTNRNQEEIKKIIRTAADMEAAGIMDFDSAAKALGATYDGVVSISKQLNKELSGLSSEALASGQAIDFIAGKVSGSAAAAMQTGAGTVKALKNEISELVILIGREWEESTRSFTQGLTEEIGKLNEVLKRSRDYRDAQKAIKDGTAESTDYLNKYTEELRRFQGQLDALLPYESLTVFELADMGFSSEAARQKAISALQEQVNKTQELLNTTKEQVKTENDLAEKTAKAAEAEYKKATIQAETAKFREENLKALDEELRKSIRSAEAKNEITAEEANKLRAIIAARKEGQAITNLETSNLKLQNQFLDANLQAYENLLVAAKGYIDGTAQSEKERFAALKVSWAAYDDRALKEKEKEEAQKRADEERKKRINELSRLHESLSKQLQKMTDDSLEEAKKQKELADEKQHQEKLKEIKKESLLEALGFHNKSAKDAIEYEAKVAKDRQAAIAGEKKQEIENIHAEQVKTLDELQAAELSKYKEGSAERLEAEKEFEEKRKALREKTASAIEQIDENLKADLLNINNELYEALERADDELLQKRLSNVQRFLDASFSIASSIATIWKNSVDYETNEKIRANNAMIQSDEERATAEKKIRIEAEQKEFEAAMYKWALDSTMATANAAMAVLQALASSPPPENFIMAGLVAAMGAAQVAAILSSQPKRPRFHSGGIVEGHGEVPAVLKAGEAVLTQKQFQNTMQAIGNLSNDKAGGGVQVNVSIENRASDKVKVSRQPSIEGLKFVVESIVDNGLSGGRFDRGLTTQQSNLKGKSLL